MKQTRKPAPQDRRTQIDRSPSQTPALRASPAHGDPAADADEWDSLTTALNRWGILHVAPGRARRRGVPRAAPDLFEALARAKEPRLQQAAIFLLLTHPQLAADAQAAIGRLAGPVRERAMRRYVAAVALQRMARTRIQLDLGPQPCLPPFGVAELGLPSPDEDYGRAALLYLAAQEQADYGYDAWGTYRALLDSFLAEIRRRGWGVVTCEPELTKRV